MIKFLKMPLIFALLACVVFVSGCARPIEVERDAAFYKELGDEYQSNKKYKKAISAYENALMRAENPEIAAEIQLALADSYFLYEEYNEAIPVYEVYLDVYSALPTADLAYLRLGLSHYELINTAGRDQRDTLAAMKYFELIRERNPLMFEENKLAEKMIYMRNLLAEKELFVGTYYARIRQYGPAVLRFQYLIETYPHSECYDEGVYRLVKALKKSNRLDEAYGYVTLLKMKHPESKYVKKTEKLLEND